MQFFIMKLDQEDVDAIAKATGRQVERVILKLALIAVIAGLVIKFLSSLG